MPVRGGVTLSEATPWTDFLRSQAHALLACDFLDTCTLSGTPMYVLAVIEHAHRRTRVLGWYWNL